jgi:hypothetical protein
MYALITNSAVAQYPYGFAQLRADNPGVSYPAEPTDAALESWGVYRVEPTPIPDHDALMQSVEEATPALISSKWTQMWTVRPATADEIAGRKQELQDEIVTATQARLDAFARTRSYDGILSACTYATSPTPKFAAEGQYCVAQRDATWAKLYEMLAEVEAGTRPIPSGYPDIEPELPALTWPNP